MLSEKGMRKLLWYVTAATRGGPTRARMIYALKQKPMNANQLATHLSLDYTTVRHHLDVLLNNKLLVVRGERYGQTYSISPFLEINFDLFAEIWLQLGSEQTSAPTGRID